MTTAKFCEICGSTDLRKVYGSSITECKGCTVHYPIEVPSSGVVTNQRPVPPSGRGSLLSRQQARLTQKVSAKNRVIDIGCGNGVFLWTLSRLASDLHSAIGVEIDVSSRKAAIRAGISVTEKIPLDIRQTFITMWHVAEHFSVKDLKVILINLSLGGNQLLISVPNGCSYSWKKHHEAFSYYDPNFHMIQFTPLSLRKLLEGANWQVEKELRTPIYGIFNAIQTGLNLYRPHNELYWFLKRSGKSISPSVWILNLLAIIRAIGPILIMLIFEFSKTKGSTYTVLCAPRRSGCES